MQKQYYLQLAFMGPEYENTTEAVAKGHVDRVLKTFLSERNFALRDLSVTKGPLGLFFAFAIHLSSASPKGEDPDQLLETAAPAIKDLLPMYADLKVWLITETREEKSL